MRFATAFFLFALFATVYAAPVDTEIKHNPGHGSGHDGMPMNDMPAQSMEDDSEPAMSDDMPMDMGDGDHEDKPHSGDQKPAKENKEDKPVNKPAKEDDMEHDKEVHAGEEGHEGHDHGSHDSEESHDSEGSHGEEGHEGHDGHDDGSHDSEGSHSEEGHEGHDDGPHDSEESHDSEGSHSEEGHEGHDHGSAMGSSDDDSMTETGSEEMPEPSSDGAEEGVCIGVSHLKAFKSHELVFEKHVLARVLCDSTGSCATSGHIVNYKGASLMMGRYCDIVGCEQKVMEVNSPRYQRGLKIPSVSSDMHFTAFAARFETRGEEAVLAAAVRAGL